MNKLAAPLHSCWAPLCVGVQMPLMLSLPYTWYCILCLLATPTTRLLSNAATEQSLINLALLASSIQQVLVACHVFPTSPLRKQHLPDGVVRCSTRGVLCLLSADLQLLTNTESMPPMLLAGVSCLPV